MPVLFTGGSGKAGKHLVAYLAAAGHRVLNVDRVPLGHPGVRDLIADITDAGQMSSAMRSHADFYEMKSESGAEVFDAVVHFAAIPRLLKPHESLLSNARIRDVLGFREQHNWRQYVG